jgi:hypothetical protein
MKLHHILFSLLLGCTQDPEPTYWSDIRPVLEGRCTNCHYEGGVGGFDLSDPDTVLGLHDMVAGSVEARSMPPWPAADGPDYAYDWRLTDEQIQLITDWSEAGAPEGDSDNAGESLETVGSVLSRADLDLTMPEPYTVRTDWSDDYRCFPIEWTGTEESYITGFKVLPGNEALVHHVAAFLIGADNLLGDSVFEQLQTWDDDEEGAGYTCFGGPSGPTGDLELPIQQIAQWVPGNQGLDFPEGTGIQVLPGSWVVLQVHYNIESTPQDPTDQSTIQFKLDENVSHRAAYAPWLNASWALGAMSIPAGQTGVSYTATADPRAFFELLNPSIGLDAGFDLHAVMVHMHELGASAEVSMLKADGTELPLVSIPEWEFDWQLSYQLAESIRFEDGDQISLTCTFDNDAYDAVDTTWGEGTADEMCVGNLYISQVE